MINLGKQKRTAHASKAIADALAEGVGERELLDMVTTVAAEQLVEQPEISGLFPDAEPIYIEDDVPEGLIDLPSAAERYSCRIPTLRQWILRGHLKVYGRLRAPAPGHGYLLVSEAELRDHMKAPRNKGGRPRKPSPRS